MIDIVHRYVIGIDPGINTGFACYDRAMKKIVSYRCQSTAKILDHITTTYYTPEDTEIVVEQSRTKTNWQKSKHPTSTFNIGMVYGRATVIIEHLQFKGFVVLERHPAGNTPDHKALVKQGIIPKTPSTNPHSRDAILIARRRGMELQLKTT